LTDYQDNSDLLADTVHKYFDRLWMAIQRSFIYLGLALRRSLFGGPFNVEGYRISNLADQINSQDDPIVVLPQSGYALDGMIELAKPTGAQQIGVQRQGNLSQLIQFVTPEQIGAIGDGIAHPLSEHYATLSAAQAVYPFVTSLTQTIDWLHAGRLITMHAVKCRCAAFSMLATIWIV